MRNSLLPTKSKTTGRPSFWNEDAKAALAAYVDQRNHLISPLADVAARLGCSPRTLWSYLQRNGIHSSSFVWDAAALTTVRRMIGKDRVLTCTVKTAAQELGCFHHTLSAWMRAHGIRPKSRGAWNAERTRRLLELVGPGNRLIMSAKSAAQRVGVSPTTLLVKMRTRHIATFADPPYIALAAKARRRPQRSKEPSAPPGKGLPKHRSRPTSR